ncbi:MAG TPA: hypothetical protein VH092_13950 [Urbifossiella sp.]|nr:hypothetical protein [Urbifossiella sp.]
MGGHCPVAEGPCVFGPAPRACEFALAGPAWRRRAVEQSALPRQTEDPTTRGAQAGVSATAYQYAAVELCDFRRSDCICLDKPARCYQAGYIAAVTLAD